MNSDFVIIFGVSVSFRIEMLGRRVSGLSSEIVLMLFHFPEKLCLQKISKYIPCQSLEHYEGM
jgi:hypothetical protein